MNITPGTGGHRPTCPDAHGRTCATQDQARAGAPGAEANTGSRQSKHERMEVQAGRRKHADMDAVRDRRVHTADVPSRNVCMGAAVDVRPRPQQRRRARPVPLKPARGDTLVGRFEPECCTCIHGGSLHPRTGSRCAASGTFQIHGCQPFCLQDRIRTASSRRSTPSSCRLVALDGVVKFPTGISGCKCKREVRAMSYQL